MQKTKVKKNALCLLIIILIVLVISGILLFYRKPVTIEKLSMDLPFGYAIQVKDGTGKILKYGTEVGGVLLYYGLSNEEITQLSTSQTFHLPDSEIVSRFLTESSRQKYVGESTKVLSGSLYGDFLLSLEDLGNSKSEEHYFFCESTGRALADVWFYMEDISDQEMDFILSSVQYAS